MILLPAGERQTAPAAILNLRHSQVAGWHGAVMQDLSSHLRLRVLKICIKIWDNYLWSCSLLESADLIQELQEIKRFPGERSHRAQRGKADPHASNPSAFMIHLQIKA